MVNFAHGSLLLVGGFVIAALHDGLGFAGRARRAAIAGAARAGGALVEFLLLRRARADDHGVLAIVTIGVDIVLTTELTRQIGTDVLATRRPVGRHGRARSAPSTSRRRRLAALAVAAALIAAFLLAFRFTSWGVAMRAAAEDARGRRADGHPARPGLAGRLGGRRRAGRGRRALPHRVPHAGLDRSTAWPRSRPSRRRSSAGSTPPPGRSSAA